MPADMQVGSLLVTAAEQGSDMFVRLFLHSGADVNHQDAEVGLHNVCPVEMWLYTEEAPVPRVHQH